MECGNTPAGDERLPKRSRNAKTHSESGSEDPTSEYLSEVSHRDRPWDKHRLEGESVEVLFEGMPEPGFDRWSARLRECAGVLEFGWTRAEDEGAGVLRLRLKSAWFCRVRHCPVCMWRRAMSWRGRMYQALPKIEVDYPAARWAFLTLTVRNVPVAELRESLKHLHSSFVRMSQRKAWPSPGWIRSTEVTRSRSGEAHPHLHCLLMVPGGYFSGGRYLSQEKWRELWRSCARLNYDPSVDVRAVKPRKGQDDLGAVRYAIVETLKYGVKVGDLLGTEDKAWAHEVARQLHKTRQVGVGGVLREYLKEEEPEQMEMLSGEDAEPDEDENPGGEFFQWRGDSVGNPRYALRRESG